MGEEVRHHNYQRYVCLAVACFALTVSSTAKAIPISFTHFKNEFQLEQGAVEIIGSMLSIGSALGYPAGLLYERFGRFISFCIALVLTGITSLLLFASQYTLMFYHTKWQLLGLWLLLFGFGTSFMFFLPIWVSVENFPARVRGSIIGFTIAFARCGSTVFGVIYTRFYQEVPIGNFFLLVAILCVLANLLSMWVLRPLPVQVNSDILKEEGLQKVYSVCFVADNGSEPANSWYAHLGIGLMKVPAFHIFSWCLFLSSAPQSAIISNITTMANSFGHKGLAMRLINYGHIVGLLITPLIGVISDWTLEYASRLVYVILGHIPLFLFLIVSIFYGDNSNIFSGLVLSSYIQIGSHSATVPTLITEYFGCHYFVRVMGAKTLTIALLETILNISIGALYQDAIIDGGTDCYGLVCFQHSFILVCVMCGMSLLLCGVLWYMERKKAQEYESMK